jgi:hypothetical protein
VNGVATLGKLVNGVAPFNMATELASGVAPLVNGEIGERREQWRQQKSNHPEAKVGISLP